MPMVIANTYYVSESGCSDSGPGTFDEPWCTIQHAGDTMVAGDTTYVREGTYEENVRPRNSGSAGNYITFAGYWEDSMPVMRGFDVSDRSYVRIISFEMFHETMDYRDMIRATGANHVEILNNYIHNPVRHSIVAANWPNTATTNLVIRGNEMYYLECPLGVVGECTGNGAGVSIGNTGSSHNLIEYNQIHRPGDYINVNSAYTIARNNYMHDHFSEYFADAYVDPPVTCTTDEDCTYPAQCDFFNHLCGLTPHPDMFQPIGDSSGNGIITEYQIYESNFMGNSLSGHSHILQIRTGDADHNLIFRGNVGYNIGSGSQAAGIDNVYYYQNTIHNTSVWYPDRGTVQRYNNEAGNNPSVDNYNFNNIYATTVDPVYIDDDGSACTSYNNLCYRSGGEANCVLGDPGFTEIGTQLFYLRSDSDARDLGAPITTTSNSGSGTAFDVVQGDFFTDGYGIVGGDLIAVGNSLARITNIDGNTITIDRSISWNNGDGVYWRNSQADAGAYPYRSGGYDITNSINLSDNDVVAGVVTVTATTYSEIVRFVEFWIDGIPVALDYDSPYEYSWNTVGEEMGSRHQVKAVARPLYASKVLGVEDLAVVFIGQGPVCGENGC